MLLLGASLYFWKLWAKSTLTNTVAALGELLQLKVSKHSNPTPTFRRIEDIFKDYFENLETIKTALLYRVVGFDKSPRARFFLTRLVRPLPQGPQLIYTLIYTRVRANC